MEDEWVIGIDEAGRGPVIGPLVVSALGVPTKDLPLLKEMGVKDSKELSAPQRLKIKSKIITMIDTHDWRIGTIICSPKRIDLNKLDSDLNSLEIDLFAEAINATSSSLKSGIIRADACDVDEVRFAQRLREKIDGEWSRWVVEAEHGMDTKDLVTGGASIIAKVTRDSEIKEIEIRTGIEIGSGYPSDQKTRIAVKKLLENKSPHDCLRWSWATVSDIWTEVHGTPVPIRNRNGGSIVQSTLEDWRRR